MRYGMWLRLSALFTVAVSALTFQSCRRSNGIDNNTVIRTPYGLYFADKQGALYNTNDGLNYRLLFPADGFAMRSITTSGLNILFIKKNVHLSLDNGMNFNPTDTTDVEKLPWQSLMLTVPAHKRVYIGVDSFNASSTRWSGVKYSDDDGKTWKVDTARDHNTITGPIAAQSFALLRNNDLFAYDNINDKLYKRVGTNSPWTLVTPNGLNATKDYFLSHFNNVLLAADTAGGAVLFSADGGLNFTAYPGLPGNRIRSLNAPFEQVLLAGTDSAGVFRLVNGAFVPANNGLATATVVHAISAKNDIYKNDVIKQYIYIGTNTGLYRSEDGGDNWVLVMPGDIRSIY